MYDVKVLHLLDKVIESLKAWRPVCARNIDE